MSATKCSYWWEATFGCSGACPGWVARACWAMLPTKATAIGEKRNLRGQTCGQILSKLAEHILLSPRPDSRTKSIVEKHCHFPRVPSFLCFDASDAVPQNACGSDFSHLQFLRLGLALQHLLRDCGSKIGGPPSPTSARQSSVTRTSVAGMPLYRLLV